MNDLRSKDLLIERFEIFRREKLCDGDSKTVTELFYCDDPDVLDSSVNYIVNGGLGYSGYGGEFVDG